MKHVIDGQTVTPDGVIFTHAASCPACWLGEMPTPICSCTNVENCCVTCLERTGFYWKHTIANYVPGMKEADFIHAAQCERCS